MTGTVTAVARHTFVTLAPEQVYDSWVDPAKVRAWGDHNLKERDPSSTVTRIEIDPKVGGRFLFADVRDGEETETWGYYRALERPNRLVFTWFTSPEEEEEDNSTVTLELSAQGAGCLATMSHEMSAEWADYIEPTANAWKGMLRSIEETADER
ncbi:SRPBCC family protein [Pelagibacterium sp. H642]|uniref:SRPBCC family protein n=1 Tax=Pelagibacterium sp. H642 TaxID=1881069 RepID=UPI002814CAC9|nr:SRPBCC family protein [Pelagibacterium sp. H642]WMT89645.1 SRPBCC domain-containing protein [Pelagibacterium sp. H642]